MVSQFTTLFHSLLHSSLPPIFPDYLKDLFTTSLAALPEHLVEPPPSVNVLQDIPHNFQKVPAPSSHLNRLGIFPRYATTLSKVAFDQIESIAKEEAAKGWDQRRLTRARQRVGEGVANWLAGMLESESSEMRLCLYVGRDGAAGGMKPMFSRFDFHLCKCFFDIRWVDSYKRCCVIAK
jgi:anaphase-promoting complex subunit 2